MRTEDSGLPFLPEPVALATDVEHMAVVQQPVQHRRGDDGVAQQFAPLAEALVRCQDDAASFTCRSSMEGWKAKSNCSSVLWKGKWAILVLVER